MLMIGVRIWNLTKENVIRSTKCGLEIFFGGYMNNQSGWFWSAPQIIRIRTKRLDVIDNGLFESHGTRVHIRLIYESRKRIVRNRIVPWYEVCRRGMNAMVNLHCGCELYVWVLRGNAGVRRTHAAVRPEVSVNSLEHENRASSLKDAFNALQSPWLSLTFQCSSFHKYCVSINWTK